MAGYRIQPMDVTLGEDALFLDFSEEEVFRLIDGHLGGGRNNPLGLGGKINVHPLSNDFEAGIRSEHTLEVSGDNDIDIYIDERRLRDVRVVGLHFPKEAIIGRAGNAHLEHFRSLLPHDGIIVRFAGSLAVVNVCDYFVEE